MGFHLMHLHGRALPLLLPKAVDRLEDYEWVDGEGELRCIFVESEPLGRRALEYRIADAKSGLRERGQVQVSDLRKCHPWGE